MKTIRRLLRLSLWLCVLLILVTAVSAASEPTFRFSLQTDGLAEKRVETGDIITVVFALERTDSTDPYTMYGMQNEIRYDSTFLEPVDGSFFLKDGIIANDLPFDDYERELYMNFLSFTGGTDWNAKTNIGSFQMRITGTDGASLISSRDCIVSLPDGSGSYRLSVSDLIVVVSDDCTVTLDSRGGSEVPVLHVNRGEPAIFPSAPVRDGYRFDGWYTDKYCTEKWDEDAPVRYNLRLYAGWTEAKESDIEALPLPFDDVADNAWYYDSVRYVYASGMMNGTSDTLFSPDTSASRAMIVTILWRMEGSPTVHHPMTFADVADGQWYTEAIRWASSEGIVNGYSDTAFGTNDTVTREQMAAILYRYASTKGYDVSKAADLTVFTDGASVSTWASDAVRWAVGTSLIQGVGGGNLNPLGTASRAQTAAILMRFCEQY